MVCLKTPREFGWVLSSDSSVSDLAFFFLSFFLVLVVFVFRILEEKHKDKETERELPLIIRWMEMVGDE